MRTRLTLALLRGRLPVRLKHSLIGVASFLMAAGPSIHLIAPALADEAHQPQAVPFVFVGKVGDCDTNYPAGSRIVTAGWLKGMGLPDNGGDNSNPADTRDNPNKQDRHFGLLLSKNGPTPDCSSAGARIKEVKGITVTPDFELGFDYRNGTHCGAGAPRFNVAVKTGSTESFHFIGGCSNGTASPAPQDPDEWTRVRFQTSNAAQAFPPIPVGSKIKTISILYDEGTDTPTVEDPRGVGLSVLDNIDINENLITRGNNDSHDDD